MPAKEGKHTPSATSVLVLEWLTARNYDFEGTARYMRDTLRIGGIEDCRKLVREALVAGYGEEYVALLEAQYAHGKATGNAESDKWHSSIFWPKASA